MSCDKIPSDLRADLRTDFRNIRVEYQRRANGSFGKTSAAEKASAEKRYEAKTCKKRVPAACWDMFQSFVTEPGPAENIQAQKSYTLSELILVVMEAAGCQVDTTNWVAFKVQFKF